MDFRQAVMVAESSAWGPSRIVPLVLGTKPSNAWTSVDLPAPEPPTMPTIPGIGTAMSMSAMAGRSRKSHVKPFDWNLVGRVDDKRTTLEHRPTGDVVAAATKSATARSWTG